MPEAAHGHEHVDATDPATPVITICSLSEAGRDVAAGSVLLNLERGLQLTVDLRVEEGNIRLGVHDRAETIDRADLPMPYDCVTCSLREQVTWAVTYWAGRHRPIVLALPPTVEPAPIVHALLHASTRAAGLAVAQVVSAVDPVTLEDDLFGDDLLDERDIAYHETDRRAVGETLAHQMESADVVTYETSASTRVDTILDHLLAPTVRRSELHRLDSRTLLAGRSAHRTEYGPPAGCGNLELPWRGNPAYAEPTGAADREGIWTVHLRSERPFSPSRLHEEIATLGSGRIRGRGHFWVATRPELRCAWDGAGGQLSIGPAGGWSGRPETSLLITGTDRDPDELRAAFERALLSAEEIRAGVPLQRDDGLDPWLGARAELS